MALTTSMHCNVQCDVLQNGSGYMQTLCQMIAQWVNTHNVGRTLRYPIPRPQHQLRYITYWHRNCDSQVKTKMLPRNQHAIVLDPGSNQKRQFSHILVTRWVQFGLLLDKIPSYIPPWGNAPYHTKSQYPWYSVSYGSPPTSPVKVC